MRSLTPLSKSVLYSCILALLFLVPVWVGCGSDDGGPIDESNTGNSSEDTGKQGGTLNISYEISASGAALSQAKKLLISIHDPAETTCSEADTASSIVSPQVIEDLSNLSGSVTFNNIPLNTVVISGQVLDEQDNVILTGCREEIYVSFAEPVTESLVIREILNISGEYKYTAKIEEELPVSTVTIKAVTQFILDSIPEESISPEAKAKAEEKLNQLITMVEDPVFSGTQTIAQTGNKLLIDYNVEEFGGQTVGQIPIVGNGSAEFKGPSMFYLYPSELIVSFTEIVITAMESAAAEAVYIFEEDLPEGYDAEAVIVLVNATIEGFRPALEGYFGDITVDSITIEGPITVDAKSEPITLSSNELKMTVAPKSGGEDTGTPTNEIPMSYDATWRTSL
jgi:hypothetical protein